jgi:hypothetical protein
MVMTDLRAQHTNEINNLNDAIVETRKEAGARKDADLRVLVCMYMCMYVYVYVRVYVCIYGWKLEKRLGHEKTLICVYWYVCMCVCVYVYVRVYVYIHG